VATMARIADRVLRTPAQRSRAVRAVNTFDRRYRRRSRRPLATARPMPRRRSTSRRSARRRRARR
jgi:hypothetical protein